MRLGIGTYALAWNIGIPGFEPEEPLDVFGVLDIARELEVQAVQYADNLPLETLLGADLDRLEAQAREAGIVLEVGARGLDMPRIERCIELAERFGSGFVRLVVDSAGDEPTPQEAVARLNVLKPKLEAHGVKLAIENHDRFPSKTLARMIEKLGPDRYAICRDTANSLGCLEGPKQVMRVLAPYTVNVHIKDVKVERANHNLGFTVTGTAAG
ncbi:sugar phosphate isomerase/epimerase, partial [bacterium]